MSKTVIFFGTDTFSAAALRSLIGAEYTIGAVITKPDSKSGRGQRLSAPLVKQIAEAHDIPVWQPAKLIDVIDDIKAINNVSEVIGVLSSYGKIIPQAIIDLFTPGIINIHPSLLPLYRGPSPIETAIANGDTQTGVSIMKLSAEMDAGPVYAQEIYALDGTETAPQLYEELSALGGHMLIETLPSIIEGNLLPSPQSNAAVYCYLLKKEDAFLNPAEITAVEAERRVRAYLAFPKTKLTLLDQPVIITKAHVSSEQTSALDIAFKGGQFLSIDELIGPSGRSMSGSAFLNGYKA
ncbi:MAG: Methionyl-tRNA formyltransferase [Candidatus Saccharibacteria bacterium]|nr:Methionyl-tRNA formyltransferase [Candidatus Saccharibacteria bacterium]